MKTKSVSRSAFLNVRVLIFVALFTSIASAVLFAVSVGGRNPPIKGDSSWRCSMGLAKTSASGESSNAVSFTDANTGTAVGEGGRTILRTTDGRAHWTIQTSGYEGTGMSLFGVSFTDANTGMAGGWNPSTGNAAVIRTTDGGNSWLTKGQQPRGHLFQGYPLQMQTRGRL